MTEFEDIFSNRIIFTEEKKEHIIKEHPEIIFSLNKIAEVLKDPDLVKRSKTKKHTFLYYKFYKDIFEGKYLLAIISLKDEPKLLTFFVTDRIKEGELIWKKN